MFGIMPPWGCGLCGQVACIVGVGAYRPGRRMNAVALSVYYSALLRPQAGDAVKGRSVREWLGEVGIRVYAGEGRGRHWHCPIERPTGAAESRDREGCSRQHGAPFDASGPTAGQLLYLRGAHRRLCDEPFGDPFGGEGRFVITFPTVYERCDL